METNWNQLIERYLQNELSEEGRAAFEQELQVNPELREELELHQLIRSAAKRASQRNLIKQTGKLYVRNLRIKQFIAGAIVVAIGTIGIIYWIQNSKQQVTDQPDHQPVAASEEKMNTLDTVIDQPNQTGDKSSLIQSSDWNSVEEDHTRSTTSFKAVKNENSKGKLSKDKKASNPGSVPMTVQLDTVHLPKTQVAILGLSNDKLIGREVENNSITENTSFESSNWTHKYDSVGKFNELYCGYALVMDNSKFGFVDTYGNIFIPLVYDRIVVTSNIKSSKQKNRRQKKKVLYIPKRSGKDVRDCEEEFIRLERNQDSLR